MAGAVRPALPCCPGGGLLTDSGHHTVPHPPHKTHYVLAPLGSQTRDLLDNKRVAVVQPWILLWWWAHPKLGLRLVLLLRL